MNKRQILWNFWDDDDYILKDKNNEDEDEDFSKFEQIKFPQPTKTIRTPIGVFPINDPFLPSKLFSSCWVGHTNFDIGQKEYEVLMTTPGIELIRLMSRYRFFMGVAKQFSFEDIRVLLDKKLCGYVSTIEKENQEIAKKMGKSHKKWAVFLDKDGKREEIVSDEDYDEEFDMRLENFFFRKNGRVVTSFHEEYRKNRQLEK